MSDFTFPKPGERVNSNAVPVPEEHLGTLLISGARDYADHPCPFGECIHCMDYVRQWEQLYSLLGETQTARVNTALDLEGIALPGWTW